LDDNKITFSIDRRLGAAVLAILIVAAGFATAKTFGPFKEGHEIIEPAFAVPATIDEVYPLFMCPCCGKALDPDNPCCGLAKERIDYISALHDAGLSNDEVILTTVKKYGVDLLIDEEMKKGVKAELARRAPADRPVIEITPVYHDFGDVSLAGGKVKTVMTIKNTGGSDLVIKDMETSCGCTSASITKDGVEGPVFGMRMHGNPTGWSVTLKPGETALLNVYYDPRVHPDLRGAVTRTISIYSNDPVDFKKDVRIEVNQVD